MTEYFISKLNKKKIFRKYQRGIPLYFICPVSAPAKGGKPESNLLLTIKSNEI